MKKDRFWEGQGSNGVVVSGASAVQSVATDGASPGLTASKLRLCSTAGARSLIPYERAVALKVLPLGLVSTLSGELLSVAVADSSDCELERTLKFVSGRRVKLITVPENTLEQAIFQAYRGDDQRLTEQVKALASSTGPGGDRQLGRLQDLWQTEDEQAQFIQSLIEYGAANKASDLHIIPDSKGVKFSLRLNGLLRTHHLLACSEESHRRLVSRLKVLAGLNTAETQRPQEGSFRLPSAPSHTSIRITLLPTIFGEKAVLRFLGNGSIYQLSELFLPPRVTFFVNRFVDRGEGALLCAGATGAGKTTTAYSVLSKFADQGSHVIGIEDPVEAQLPGVSQTSVARHRGVDYSTCLKSALRQDPDVFFVGEIRDLESASIALQGVLTGHALVSTIHARSCSEVLLRLFSLGVDMNLSAQALRLVLTQRLVPSLCRECRCLDEERSKDIGVKVYTSLGCSRCSEGKVQERVPIVELLWFDRAVRQSLGTSDISVEFKRRIAHSRNYWSAQQSLRWLLLQERISGEVYLSETERMMDEYE